MQKIEGEVRQVYYFNEESGWAVFDLEEDSHSHSDVHKVTGSIYEVYQGLRLTVEGEHVTHPKYGKSFRISSYRVEDPTSLAGIIKFLEFTLPNVGPVRADYIVEKFGRDTLKVLDERIEELVQIPGIKREDLPNIRSLWNVARGNRELVVFLAQFGLSRGKITDIIRSMPKATIASIRQDPYILTDVGGVGFKTVDAFAMSMGLDKNSEGRQRGVLHYCLKEGIKKGHVYLTMSQLLSSVKDLSPSGMNLSLLSTEKVKSLLASLQERESVVLEGDRVYTTRMYHAEQDASNYLIRQIKTALKPILPEEELSAFKERYEGEMATHVEGFKFSEDQLEALRCVNQNSLAVVTGLPGTGKTTTIRAITRLLEEANMSFELCAPTGKAARRLEEVTGRTAQTMHRTLGIGLTQEDRDWAQANLQALDALILDETSMLDAPLFATACRSLPSHCRLVLVGDPAQLPSVGPGSVLRDLKESQSVPKAHLTQIHRQALESDIVFNAHRVLKGEDIQVRGKGDLTILRFPSQGKIEETLMKVAEKLVAARSDCQILCPMRKVQLGTDNLNDKLRKVMNPLTTKAYVKWGDKKFYRGDRVLVTKNMYLHGVVNGDTGAVTTLDVGERVVEGAFDSVAVPFKGEELNNLDLSYAMTIHKSQGSEWDVVVLVLHKSHQLLLNRNLLYTAMTRAKKKLIILTDSSSLGKSVRNEVMSIRNSNLRIKVDDAFILEQRGNL